MATPKGLEIGAQSRKAVENRCHAKKSAAWIWRVREAGGGRRGRRNDDFQVGILDNFLNEFLRTPCPTTLASR